MVVMLNTIGLIIAELKVNGSYLVLSLRIFYEILPDFQNVKHWSYVGRQEW